MVQAGAEVKTTIITDTDLCVIHEIQPREVAVKPLPKYLVLKSEPLLLQPVTLTQWFHPPTNVCDYSKNTDILLLII